MTEEKTIRVLEEYYQYLESMDVEPIKILPNIVLQNPEDGLAHCMAMIPETIKFLKEGRIEKAYRWLGFIQGVLWANGQYNINDLKSHNKPA